MFGFLNCNKPKGFTSRDAVNVVQGRLKSKKIKVGHCGTLDPLAEGVLVIGVGPASRLVPFVHEQPKRYTGWFRLGAESPTGDLEVEPTVYSDHPRPEHDAIERACVALTGQIEQTPPIYSAVKVGGKRAYDQARKGRDIEIPPRQVRIDRINVRDYRYPNLELDIICGSGTYIRTLGIDLAKRVGTTAVMTSLTRTAVGAFPIERSVSIDAIRTCELESLLLPAELGVAHLRRLVIDEAESTRIGNGLCLDIGEPNRIETPPVLNGFADFQADKESIAAVSTQGRLRALLKPRDDRWCPHRVFPKS